MNPDLPSQSITRLPEPAGEATAAPPSHPRFEILSRIGEGGMGIVYLALDREHDAHVALKTIARMGAASLLRFKNEFRALADLVHPNLVRLFELLGEDAVWFFTMEYVDGQPFVDAIRPPAGPGDASARLRAAFPQLVEGVAAIHASGKLHCDLKPSNVLVANETGRVVVLDFGLVTPIEVSPTLSGSHGITGTVAFMSPEQARGDRLSEASDWYSVGVILYQALTGRLPIDGPDLTAVLERKQSEDPIPPRILDPAVPDDLSALCLELLSRDPAQRPDARAILRRLERPASARFAGARRFVGRDEQLAVLHSALRDVRSGRQQTVYVHGLSGVGKTALTERFLEEVGDGAFVLPGRCYERESVPYKAFDAVIDALARRLDALADAPQLLTSDAAYLVRVFPVLSQVAAIQNVAAQAPRVADVQEVRRRAFAGLRELLRRLAGRYPLILTIDDLQWTDLDSTGLLAALLAPPNAPRLLFLGSYRSEYAETSTALQLLLAQVEGAHRLAVGLLSDSDSAALVHSLLGDSATAATVATIVREAGGVPLFVEHLVQAVDDVGDGDRAHPLSFEAVLHRRLSALDASSRRLLEHIAVGGQPLPQGPIVRAANITPEDALRDLATLRSQQWVRTHGIGRDDNIEPFHDRIRESITASLSAETLSGHHLSLAQALEPAGVDPEVLAVHWSGAGRLDEATHHAVRAADRAAQTLAFNRAARLYELALGWQPAQSARRRALRTSLATALAHAGRSIEAGDAYLAAIEGSDMYEALLHKQRAAEQYLNHGHVEQGYALLADLVRSVGLRMPKRGTYALASLLTQRALLRLRGLRYRRRNRKIPPETLRQIDVCLMVGQGLSMIEPLRGAEFQTRALRMALATGDPKRAALALALEAALEAVAGERVRRRVDTLLEQSEALAAELDDAQIVANGRFMRGVTHYLRGEWRASLALCREAESIWRERCVNVWWGVDQAASYCVWNLCYLGQLGEAATRVAPLLKEAGERGDRLLTSQLLTGITVLVPLSQGQNPEQVREQLVSGVRPWQGGSYNMPHLLLLFGLSQIDLYLGRGSGAWARFERERASIRSSLLLEVQFIAIEVLGLRARCALAASIEAAEPRPLLAEARRAADALERIGTAWALAYATPVRAQLHMAAGADASAAELLRIASERFSALDMRLHAATADYRLAQLIGGEAGLVKQAESMNAMRILGINDRQAMVNTLIPHHGRR